MAAERLRVAPAGDDGDGQSIEALIASGQHREALARLRAGLRAAARPAVHGVHRLAGRERGAGAGDAARGVRRVPAVPRRRERARVALRDRAAPLRAARGDARPARGAAPAGARHGARPRRRRAVRWSASAAQRARDALAKLKPSEREAVVLRYEGELSFRELAAACGVDEAAARKRVSRALSRLRVRFGRGVRAMSTTEMGELCREVEEAISDLLDGTAPGAALRSRGRVRRVPGSQARGRRRGRARARRRGRFRAGRTTSWTRSCGGSRPRGPRRQGTNALAARSSRRESRPDAEPRWAAATVFDPLAAAKAAEGEETARPRAGRRSPQPSVREAPARRERRPCLRRRASPRRPGPSPSAPSGSARGRRAPAREGRRRVAAEIAGAPAADHGAR